MTRFDAAAPAMEPASGPDQPRLRICLGECQKAFQSSSRGHRLCDRCNAKNAQLSRLAAVPIRSVGAHETPFSIDLPETH